MICEITVSFERQKRQQLNGNRNVGLVQREKFSNATALTLVPSYAA